MKYQIIREIKGYRTEQDARDERNPINRDFEAGWDLCVEEYDTKEEAEENLPDTEIEKDGLDWIRTEYYINERDDSFFRVYDTTGGKFEDIGRDYEAFETAYKDAVEAIKADNTITEIQIQKLDSNDEYDGFTRTLKKDGRTVTEYDTHREYFAEWEIERYATCILRGDFLSDTSLAETIANVYSDVKLTEEEADEIYDKVVKTVNELLPEEMLWQPSTSEIFGMSDQEITEDEFTDLLDQAFNSID